jgi:ABC-type sugar transport system ATPase subunit
VTVLRDGRHVETRPTAGLDEARLVQMMIGRRLDEYLPQHVSRELGGEVLSVVGLSCPGRFQDVSFRLRGGEVLGFAGLVGAGRSEVAQALFGMEPGSTGRVMVFGRHVALDSPAAAMRVGLGLVPEDRKRQGLVLSLGGGANTTLPILEKLSVARFVKAGAERAVASDYFAKLRVRSPSLDFEAQGLSGGNQQKLVLAKWLAAQCSILILDEPTRGVDVGAKAEIHALIDSLAASGKAILLISSEMPELLSLSTRILVLREGRLVGELARAEASEASVMRLMAGVAA